MVLEAITNKVSITIVNAGVKDSATTRGAVQFTEPDRDHCIGNLACVWKREFARIDNPIITSPIVTARISTAICISLCVVLSRGRTGSISAPVDHAAIARLAGWRPSVRYTVGREMENSSARSLIE